MANGSETARILYGLDIVERRGCRIRVTDHQEPAFWVDAEGLDEEIEDLTGLEDEFAEQWAAWCRRWEARV